ncbi:MAG: 1-aminocyclopropane-1-carboxylate deaminase [Verrucomicrobia bacterium]|nr:1-aminocyclopropane-1-carboxylate deaminase [Verrucomicrobiota bacterium]
MKRTSSIPRSRLHKLKTFSNDKRCSYVKRDDELGFGISGSKLRKYNSLLPYLIANRYEQALLIGTAYSNHILGLTQLLLENRIKPLLFLLGDPKLPPKGNLLLLSLLVEKENCHWLTRSEWPEVEVIAKRSQEESPLKTLVVPEGASFDIALPGALTLAVDILENEKEMGPFDHIFIDAGTGLSAIATILAFAFLEKKTVVHVVLLAGTKEAFLENLRRFHKSFEALLRVSLEEKTLFSQFRLYKSREASAFGSTNSTIFKEIGFLAKEEGFFTDPIYSAKLFLEASHILKEEEVEGNVLVIHSGGALTLMGFQKELLLIAEGKAIET